MTSSNINHFVYLKLSTQEDLALNDWLQLKAGVPYKYEKTFTAQNNANSLYFGVGGDLGNRTDSSTDEDAAIRYAALPGYETLLSGIDISAATRLTLTDFKLVEAKKAPAKVKLTKVKAAKKGKVNVKYKKIKGVAGYQIQYSYKKNMKAAKAKTTKKATYTLKKLKKGKKVYVRVRAYFKGKVYGAWSAKKSVKVK